MPAKPDPSPPENAWFREAAAARGLARRRRNFRLALWVVGGSVILATATVQVFDVIRRLELFLGVQLFERHRRGIVVTEKGEKLYRHAKRVIALLEETPEAVKGKEAA